jgi:hypothetical protein
MIVADEKSKDYALFQDVKSLYHAPRHLEDFYRSFGCKVLAEIITETAQPEGEDKSGSGYAAKTRELVLEGLKPFIPTLKDAGRIDRYKWMTEGENFKVRVFRKVRVVKVLNFGGKSVEQVYDTTVAHRWVGSCFELLLAASRVRNNLNDESVTFYLDLEERDLVACQMLCLDSSSTHQEGTFAPFSPLRSPNP